jgi:hypothetical protein
VHIEDVLYLLKRSGVKRKTILFGCLVILTFAMVLLVIAIILAVNYHTQIYDGFLRIINFIFGDSLNNVVRNVIKQLMNNYIVNLFKES